MVKTTLDFTGSDGDFLVEITSTESLTENERDQVGRGIKRAFSWCFDDEDLPYLDEIRSSIRDYNPRLAEKITDMRYLL